MPVPVRSVAVVMYYQTHHDLAGNPISLHPLAQDPQVPTVTHVILAALHIGDPPHILTLNEHTPTVKRFDVL
ncbi:ATP-dependent DNA helicase pif1 [Fusarium oxysporum f. sp. albedinis]|nr:ATP-dependent DNA helicase pif1 [Fusarium oxysporum f. sp. albedinis]